MLDANLADRKVVQYVINRFGIHAKHRLGQNFLVRPDIVAAIADAAEITPDVSVMEIGAGIGTLTQALAERGSDVIAFEVDQSLKRVLDSTMETAVKHLKKGGRIGVITFHSLEDRIIKQSFKRMAKGCICPPELPVCVCGHKPELKKLKEFIPSETELEDNPRARSARLRGAIKI